MTRIQSLETLARFAVLLNSHHDQKTVISLALEEINKEIRSEGATLFLKEGDSELVFWASQGGASDKLEGATMPMKGIVGWVVENRESVIVQDVSKDPRFFKDIDTETSFVTKNLICAPLIVRGSEVIGALEVINSTDDDGFTSDELKYLEALAGLTALAVDNARLVTRLIDQTQHLQEMNKKKEDTLSIIAHEFRTPLNIMQMSSDMLANKMYGSAAEEAMLFKTLTKGVTNLTQKILEVRDATLTSRTSIAPELSKNNICSVIKDVLSAFTAGAQGRKITLRYNEPKEELVVWFDPALMHLALSHLMRNGIRYTPDGGTITVAVSKSSGFVRISFTDTGIGISKEQQKAIFEKFFEAVSIMKHSSGDLSFRSAGLGLGLSTARSIARAHKGDLVVQSEEGKGSTFTLTVPA